MTVQELLELREYLSVAGHTPGRLSLKFSLDVLRHPAAPGLMKLAAGRKNNPVLIRASLNPLSCSALLEYDSGLLEPADLDRFFSSRDPEEVKKLAGKVAGLFGVDIGLT